MAPGIIFRINPKQCKYEELNPEGQDFSTKGRNLLTSGLTVGSYLFPIASGSGRRKGLLGIWQVIEAPALVESKRDPCYKEPYATERTQRQYRVKARRIYQITRPNGSDLTEFSRQLRQVVPVILDATQTERLRELGQRWARE